METLHPEYVVDDQGVPKGVLLGIDEFRRLLDAAGLPDDPSLPIRPLRIVELGWTREETLETRLRLRSFEGDWEAPGMDAYDRL